MELKLIKVILMNTSTAFHVTRTFIVVFKRTRRWTRCKAK
jgi:hypothetical protein